MSKSAVEVFEKSGIYNGFIKNMPYPFNNLYFVIAIGAVIICLIALYVIQDIKTKALKKKIRQRQEEARLKRLTEEENEKNERIELMELMRNQAGADTKNSKEYRATHDVNTGLLNKLSYNKALSGMNINDMLVIYADINNLKKTNDQYGKENGDRLLMAVAAELKENFPDRCYRVGGDEFIVLAGGMSEKIAVRKTEKIKDNLKALTESDADGVIYSLAIGIATGDGSKTKQEVIDLAEERMKQDKKNVKEELRASFGDDEYVDNRVTDYISEDNNDKDIMTGCLTKEAFDERISSIDETNLSIISADIDGLKLINDKLSHHAGDMVIKGFARVMRKYFPGCVYRISDDDFCVVTKSETRDSLYEKLESVKMEMIRLTENAEKGVFYSASFGVSTNAADGDMLIDVMLDECLIKMREDKEAFRTGKRCGVTINNTSVQNKVLFEEKKQPEYDIEGILNEKREESDTKENEEKNALTTLLYSMASKQEEVDIEAEIEEKRKREKEEMEELLNEEIKARFNKEDLTGIKRSSKRQNQDAEDLLKNELEKIKQEQKKRGEPKRKKKNKNKEGSSGDIVTGNTVDDVDIL